MTCHFQGKFKRRPQRPAIDVPNGWFAVNFSHVTKETDGKHDKDKSKAYRHTVHGRWFKISSDKGSVIRVIRFAANNQLAWTSQSGKKSISAKKVIWVDWQAWIELNGRTGVSDESLDLKFEEVGWWRAALGALGHPDPAVKVSVCLGLLSLALAVVSFVVALN